MCNLVKNTLEDNEEDNRIPLDAIVWCWENGNSISCSIWAKKHMPFLSWQFPKPEGGESTLNSNNIEEIGADAWVGITAGNWNWTPSGSNPRGTIIFNYLY